MEGEWNTCAGELGDTKIRENLLERAAMSRRDAEKRIGGPQRGFDIFVRIFNAHVQVKEEGGVTVEFAIIFYFFCALAHMCVCVCFSEHVPRNSPRCCCCCCCCALLYDLNAYRLYFSGRHFCFKHTNTH